MSIPQLWNVINICGTGDVFVNIAGAGVLARRSGRQPLELRLSVNHSRISHATYAHLSTTLAEFFPRIETLIIQIWDAVSFERSFPLRLDLPSLRTMVISYEDREMESDCPYVDHHPEFEVSPSSVPGILSYPTPALESISVGSSYHGYGINSFSPLAISSLINLRHLDLVGSEFESDASVEILAALPNLEVLACESHQIEQQGAHILSFPYLKRMYVGRLSPTTFLHIEAPRLEVLYLDQLRKGWQSIRETLEKREQFPMLRSLGVEDPVGFMLPMEVLELPGLTELTLYMTSETLCKELFDRMRLPHTLHTLRLSPNVTLQTCRSWETVINPEVIISALAGFIWWRRATSNRHPLHILFNISRNKIPSLTSFCNSVEDDDSLRFSFSSSLDGEDMRLSRWWRENTSL